MFSSLQAWCNYPIKIRRSTGHTLSGDTVAGSDVNVKCYIAEEVVLVTDKYGKEYVSRTQLYLPTTTIVTQDDMIILDGKSYEIRLLNGYRDGNTNSLSMQVIFL